jgi:hypothetical protein
MAYLKTDQPGLVRDSSTHAIINNNDIEYKSFIQNRKNSNQIEEIENNLTELKQDFIDIKIMLKELLNRK